jgi:hypothetical protein
MRQFILSILATVVMMLGACGGGGGSNTSINGNWSATLTNTDGATALAFTVTLTGNSSSSGVSVTNLSFTTASSCFGSGTTGIATFTTTGTVNGVTSGNFQMTIQSGMSNSKDYTSILVTRRSASRTRFAARRASRVWWARVQVSATS